MNNLTVKNAIDVVWGDMIYLQSIPKEDLAHTGLVTKITINEHTVHLSYMHKNQRFGVTCAKDDRIQVEDY